MGASPARIGGRIAPAPAPPPGPAARGGLNDALHAARAEARAPGGLSGRLLQEHGPVQRPPITPPRTAVSAAASSRGGGSRSTPEAVIFLDIDGVLHSLMGSDLFRETCCGLLVDIVRGTGASIVLSSAWRTDARARATVTQVLKKLKLANYIDMTKDLSAVMRRQVPRSAEICEWLDRHPGVQRWIAIDDMDLVNEPGDSAKRLRGHFVRTPSTSGLSPQHLELALKLMQKQKNPGGSGGPEVGRAADSWNCPGSSRGDKNRGTPTRPFEESPGQAMMLDAARRSPHASGAVRASSMPHRGQRPGRPVGAF